MRRLSHGTLLAVANAALVLLTVAALAGTGALLVRRLVAAQAHQRAASAAATAAREVRAAAERLEVGAKLLADRPSLQRLDAAGRRRELADFLASFRETSAIAGAAVLRDGKLWAGSGGMPPEPPREGVSRWIADPEKGPLLLVARVRAEGTRSEVVLWQTLDESFAARLTRQVGMPVRVVRRASPAPARSLGRAVAALPSELSVAGVVEASLPPSELVEPVSRLLRGYALAACLAAALALAAGLLLARRLGAPAQSLGRAAARIGAGDLQTPVRAPWGGEMGQLGATLEDMRQRLSALTAELARREAEATAVLGGIVEGVLAVDEERRVTYLNPGAAELLGVDAEQARGAFCGDLLRPEAEGGSVPCHERCPIVHARDGGRGTARELERIRPPGGVPRVVVVSCSPPEGGSQVLVLRDETEQEAGRRVREAILANLSHELKTPLAAQLASVELLREGLGAAIPPREARELVAALERSTLRLMGLVDNLLASSRLEAGEWGMRRETVELPEVAEEAAALLAPLFVQRRQELVWELADLPAVRGDRTQLLQVVLNLLGNANKFAPDGSVVRVGGEAPAGVVVLWVEDEGPGLPPGSVTALFERFRRAPGATPRGVGLGLWIVRSVVERHGGTVAASAGSRGGARFTVTLPRPEASAA
jgi:two-component system phosphate regulon sensor histidine kinase PhoR